MLAQPRDKFQPSAHQHWNVYSRKAGVGINKHKFLKQQ